MKAPILFAFLGLATAQATETVGSVTRAYSLKCKPTQRMF